MLGHNLDWWNTVMLSFLAIGAIAAVIVVVATAIVIKLQDKEFADAKEALEQYKISAKAEADIKINAARDEARTQNKILEKATADANKAASEANERAEQASKAASILNERAAALEAQAATAQRDAEQARLEQKKIEAAVAWRRLTAEQHKKLLDVLASAKFSMHLEYSQSDPEATQFADDIFRTLKEISRNRCVHTSSYYAAGTHWRDCLRRANYRQSEFRSGSE